jgi:hypothetical protein
MGVNLVIVVPHEEFANKAPQPADQLHQLFSINMETSKARRVELKLEPESERPE